MNSKERCLAAIKGRPVDRVPVFPLLMFFAQQRYGITYREFATNGRALADAQLSIREKFPLDAVTACSDAFRITADLGADMAYPEDGPPFAKQPLVGTRADLDRLRRPDPQRKGSRMADRVLGAGALASEAGKECLVLGWVDMPFAEACSLCGVSQFMMMLVDDPSLAHAILQFLTEIVIEFSLAQLEPGVAGIGAGDAATSLISAAHYREFALPYEQMVVNAVHQAGSLVKLHICGTTTHLLNDMVQSGADLFNVDHLVSFDTACDVYGSADKCFKGNLDPVAGMLQSNPQACEEHCLELLHRARGLRYMLSPGCEVPGDTDDEIFRAFCRAPQVFREIGLDESYDAVRNGARLVLRHDAHSYAFLGYVENTTEDTLKQVRVEVHLSNGVELGPTTPADLEPGARLDVSLVATSKDFDGWTAHPEVGEGGEHGQGESDGEHGEEGEGEHGEGDSD